ncbi:MAG: BLUF domain-containing protein [Phycisphaeraceae bacterium]|nr:MAG: BLUF domain-containing protein [Phycisphaeraceae bacterium]
MALKQLLYISRPTQDVTREMLNSIASAASMRNPAFSITGLLLLGNGLFMQMLEGPPDCVETLLDTIRDDPRHRGLEVLLEREVESRFFPDWSMGSTASTPTSAR